MILTKMIEENTCTNCGNTWRGDKEVCPACGRDKLGNETWKSPMRIKTIDKENESCISMMRGPEAQ